MNAQLCNDPVVSGVDRCQLPWQPNCSQPHCIWRRSEPVHFTPEALLKQRIFQIAAGYEYANHAKTLRDDPIFKLRLDRLPETGAPLASQLTISRLANLISRLRLWGLRLSMLSAYALANPTICPSTHEHYL